MQHLSPILVADSSNAAAISDCTYDLKKQQVRMSTFLNSKMKYFLMAGLLKSEVSPMKSSHASSPCQLFSPIILSHLYSHAQSPKQLPAPDCGIDQTKTSPCTNTLEACARSRHKWCLYLYLDALMGERERECSQMTSHFPRIYLPTRT